MATYRSLKTVRQQLVVSYMDDLIDAEEFVLLYDAYQSKDIYPYWKYDNFDIRMFDDEQCVIDFRFVKTGAAATVGPVGPWPDHFFAE